MRHLTLGFVILFSLQSCEETFLDVVPDNVATLDQAFKLRNEAEKYLFTCYAYMPKNGDPIFNIAMLSGDELWIPPQDLALDSNGFDIARGFQRNFNTYMDAWEGRYQGAGPADLYPLFDGIRNCNVLIENLEDPTKVPDISQPERQRWIAEGKFLKAYYHYYLMRMYGPIPIMRTVIPVDAPESELYVRREPVDDVTEYIVQLLDESIDDLPGTIQDQLQEYGRATKAMAAGLKSQILLTAASPLFNGNDDMAGFNAEDGTPFFNQNYSIEKWQAAADAAKEAIDIAEANGHQLYTFADFGTAISDTTRLKLSIRQALSERGNPEVIWANLASQTVPLQLQSMVPLDAEQPDFQAQKILAPPIKIANLFYSKNGVPINEDRTLNFTNVNELRTAVGSERLNIAEGYQTARINFDREPRFYADLGFDGSVFYIENSGSNETKWHIEGKFDQYSGSNDIRHYNVTGYYLKKVVNYRYSNENGGNYYSYAWPELRLAELYLNYAEALNEAQGPSQEVYRYIDLVRERAGLEGVVESWAAYSNSPSKPTTQSGLQEIIQRERNIELSFEGKRYWDLRRWKLAARELNEPIRAWNVYGETNTSYYQIRTLFQQRFASPRDYFWPISEGTLRQNPNLVQNPGW